VTKSLKTYLVN